MVLHLFGKIKIMERTTNGRLVTAVFPDKSSADRAYTSLHSRGYSDKEISVIMSDATLEKHFAHETVKTELGNKALKGTGTGAVIGTAVGATIAAIAAVGTNLILPGLGLIVAGPLAAGLAGAGAGAATGSIVGALVGAGIPEERAKFYEDGVKKGEIVIGVHARDDKDAEYYANEWPTYNGKEIHR
jgi:hypothetical protein